MPDQDPRPTSSEGNDRTGQAAFFRAYTAEAALVGVVARVDSLLSALEARPETEGPLQAFTALLAADEGEVLTVGDEERRVLELIAESPSLAGRFLWKVEAIIARMALEFGRRMSLPHTDLRPQLLAAGVVAALNAALLTWFSEPSSSSLDELSRQALAHLAEGVDWPSAKTAE